MLGAVTTVSGRRFHVMVKSPHKIGVAKWEGVHRDTFTTYFHYMLKVALIIDAADFKVGSVRDRNG